MLWDDVQFHSHAISASKIPVNKLVQLQVFHAVDNLKSKFYQRLDCKHLNMKRTSYQTTRNASLLQLTLVGVAFTKFL